MFVCTRWKSGTVSPRGEHFLRNSFVSVLRKFVLLSYTFFSFKKLFSYFFFICYSGLPEDHRLSRI